MKKIKEGRINAYDKDYIYESSGTLARMFFFGYHDMGLEIQEIYDMFVDTIIAHEFGAGNPKFTVGMSGAELFSQINFYKNGEYIHVDGIPSFRQDKIDMSYWVGWILAYYQWNRNIEFIEFRNYGIPMEKFTAAYPAMHQCSLEWSFEKIDNWFKERGAVLA